LRILEQRHGVQELVQIVDTKILRELLRHICFNQDVLHHGDRTKFLTLLEEDRLVDRREVLQKVDSVFTQFHVH
jgi:hypothetical protein